MKHKTFWKNILIWIKDYQLPFIYFLLATAIEMTAVFTVEGNAFMTRPMLMFGLLLFFVGVMLAVPKDGIRVAIGGTLLVVQIFVDLVFAALYDMTGQYFEFSLLNLRNDAVAALEKIPVNFLVFYMGLFCCIAFIAYGLRLIAVAKAKAKKTAETATEEKVESAQSKECGCEEQSAAQSVTESEGAKQPKTKLKTKIKAKATRVKGALSQRKSFLTYLGVAAAGVATLVISFVSYFPQNTDKYEEMVYGKSTSVYASYGMLGNLVGEIGLAIRGDKSTMTNQQIENFIYNENKKSQPTFIHNAGYMGKGKNVVVILSESFEWYSFMNSQAYYEVPNALKFTDEQLAQLYPNLTRFYNESVVATNFHAREKTDAAETISILGSYPTEKYISYDYCDNSMPQTLPNVLKTLDTNIQTRSFHNGYKDFYNRITTHESFGFESLTDMNDMEKTADELYKAEKAALEEMGASKEEIDALKPIFTDYWDKYDEMNLDSEMFNLCRDEMFPKDKRFYTYITTISMHGAYYERRNLAAERAEVEKVLGVNLPNTSDTQANILLHYMVTAKEFDDAIGVMYDDLESKGILDDTIILMFGDHNAYYNELSNYVKDIDGYDTERKFTDMYKVPLMVRADGLVEVLENKKMGRFIDKFTCTADIVPTLFDLLGITYFTNMYYGHSIFDYTVTDNGAEYGNTYTPVESVLYSRSYDIFAFDGIVGRSVKTYLYKQESLAQSRIDTYEREAKTLVEKIKYCDYIFKQDYFANQTTRKKFQDKLVSIQAK